LYFNGFLQMCSPYLIEPVACTPASGREKGLVENQVARALALLHPTPAARLTDKCIAYAKAHRPELTGQTIWEVF
jgi:hypothetical protein